jgi:hypothetical protein
MNAATIAGSAPLIAPGGRLRRFLAMGKNIAIGTLLCTNPVTAIAVLGWLMRRMRSIADGDAQPPGWLMAKGESRIARFAGGLLLNVQEGFGAAFTLLLATLPFTALWTLAWWAGWENSFNKGYEQAVVGPLLSLTAVAIAIPVLSLLPMALAHQASQRRWRAFFEWRAVRALIARGGWRYAGLTVLFSVFALPILFFRVLPLFAETFVPGLATMNAEETAGIAEQLLLAHAAVVFISVMVLRGLSARVYRHARRGLEGKAPGWPFQIAQWAVMFSAAFAIVAQIYVGQFFNHGWAKWISHPEFLLPLAH